MGAERMDILRLIVADGGKLALVGAIAGCGMARVAAPAVAGLLYGVPATDGSIMISAAGLCVTVAILACLFPARRATRVDPMITLRLE
jgi:ABC-type lipoprotein release transport system permease subunit